MFGNPFRPHVFHQVHAGIRPIFISLSIWQARTQPGRKEADDGELHGGGILQNPFGEDDFVRFWRETYR